jgi:adenylylsulfate kinase
MKEKANQRFKESWLRSLAKTVTYRIAILILDFTVIYLLTQKFEIAFGFMIISNIYTSIGYYAHERIWDGIKWGKKK